MTKPPLSAHTSETDKPIRRRRRRVCSPSTAAASHAPRRTNELDISDSSDCNASQSSGPSQKRKRDMQDGDINSRSSRARRCNPVCHTEEMNKDKKSASRRRRLSDNERGTISDHTDSAASNTSSSMRLGSKRKRNDSKPSSKHHRNKRRGRGSLAQTLSPAVKTVRPPFEHDQVQAHPFYQLGLNEAVTSAVIDLSFVDPTPVQYQAIPEVLAGRDLIAHAQTGTGKTAAFILPALQMIAARNCPAQARSVNTSTELPCPDAGKQATSKHQEALPSSISDPHLTNSSCILDQDEPSQALTPTSHKPSVRMTSSAKAATPHLLVLTPTRELASQIAEVGNAVSAFTGHHVVTVIGGARFDRQIKQLQTGCDALIATPGRLLDLISQQVIDLSQVRILVLDEADRMLDMGFWPSVKQIERQTSRRRQTLFFSATTTARVTAHAKTLLKDPVTVSVTPQNATAVTIEEQMMCVVDAQKLDLLFTLMQRERPERVLIFCKTKQRVDMVAQRLQDLSIRVGVMHADRAQKQRERALAQFSSGKLHALVATDVMSRGIDISCIDWVVNYDVPADPEDYVHRIGRTGRAGQTGRAITLVAPEEITQLREVEYFTKHLIDHVDLPDFPYDAQRIVPSPSRRAAKGGAGSRRMGARRHGRSL